MTNSDSPTTTISARRKRDRRSRGQIIVIFAGAAIAFMALSAIVIDVSWYWSSQVRMQRAADAAALAGVVRLPGDLAGGQILAQTEASRNGYTNGVNGITVTPDQDPASTRRMVVTISGPINTFFARIIGLNSFPATVTSKAQFVLPVPMGSPDNYWGVFGLTRGLTSTTTTTSSSTATATTVTSSLTPNNTAPAGGLWSFTPATGGSPTRTISNIVETDNDEFAQETTSGESQQWANFGFGVPAPAANQNVVITAIEVRFNDTFINTTCAGGAATIGAALSWDAGGNWSTTATSGALDTPTANAFTIGSATDMTGWGAHTWTRTTGTNELSDANFRVRLTFNETCTGAKTVSVDRLRVRVTYDVNTVTTTTNPVLTYLTDVPLKGPGDPCAGGVPDCYTVVNGLDLPRPQNFWGTMNTQGAANANGDAYQPYYDTPTSGVAVACNVALPGKACYDPNEYYNYAIEMPQGSTGGKVYIYDPGFCDVLESKGTGDRWFDTSTPDTDAITSTYEVWDTKNTLYDRGDDGPLNNGTLPDASSDDKFRSMRAADTSMGGFTTAGVNECRTHTDSIYNDARDYHNKWYLLYSGMSGYATGPHIYRVHTTSTDPDFPIQQRIANGENSFAIYADATGGTPRVYGLGAMEAFTPLKAAGSTVASEFYLAQIDKVHATKTVEISLWDPGDTDPLTSSIEIEVPTATTNVWAATPVTYSATLGTTNSGRADGTGSPAKPDCRTLSRTVASTVPISTFNNADATNTGKFNGCWLTIQAVIPANYNAEQGGWWKIKYTMNGGTSGSPATSNDVTTWKVQILGNPVHLIVN